jgi:hypothetical protein
LSWKINQESFGMGLGLAGIGASSNATVRSAELPAAAFLFDKKIENLAALALLSQSIPRINIICIKKYIVFVFFEYLM